MSKRKGIFLVGRTCTSITGNKLPFNGQILAMFFHHHKELKKTKREASVIVVRAALSFWELARIPARAEKHLVAKLEKLFDEWRRLLKSKGNNSDFQRAKEKDFSEIMDNLFDMAHQDAHLLINIKKDKEFLEAQREKGRRGSMAGVDKNLDAMEKRIRVRKAREAQRRQQLEDPGSSTVVLESSSSNNGEEDNTEEKESPGVVCEVTPDSRPKRAKRNIMTTALAAALDRTKTSDRNATYVLAEATSSLGYVASQLNINRTSIRRHRKRCRMLIAKELKKDFATDVPLVVHWDVKMLHDLTGKAHVERLPVLLSGQNVQKLLGVPKLESGTGENVASAVAASLEEWNVVEQVKAMCFDTTAANTGHRSGACTLLEQKIDKDLLWLACRHHILELLLASAFRAVMVGSSGPDVLLFKRFQAKWGSINHTAFQPGPTDKYVEEILHNQRDDIIAFARTQLERCQPRDDYRELLELTITFAGGVPPRGIRFMAPGAMHHARWMSKITYSLKTWMFRGQFKLNHKEETGLRDISIFCVVVYVRHWMMAPNSIVAPRNDLQLMNSLLDYETIHSAISKATSMKFRDHLWYLSEELVGLAIFDEEVSLPEKRLMQEAMQEEGAEDPPKRHIPHRDLQSFKKRKLSSYFSVNTKNLFMKLCIQMEFLNTTPDTWEDRQDFQHAKAVANALRVVNDSAERGVALVQNFNRQLTKSEDQLQFLLQVVEEHRRQFPDCRKGTLTQTWPHRMERE